MTFSDKTDTNGVACRMTTARIRRAVPRRGKVSKDNIPPGEPLAGGARRKPSAK